VPADFLEPTDPRSSRAEVFLGYLDHFREAVVEKVESLPPVDAARSVLPSGWTPVELLLHLRHVERRWLEWGFLGLDVGDPWADEHDGRWHVPDSGALSVVVQAGPAVRVPFWAGVVASPAEVPVFSFRLQRPIRLASGTNV